MWVFKPTKFTKKIKKLIFLIYATRFTEIGVSIIIW